MFFLNVCFRTDGLLKQFVDDLNSGKLHREFHYGPDPVVDQGKPQINQQANQGQQGNKDPTPSGNQAKDPTTPPESVFNKLKPSYNRYTILKDEL